MMCLKKFLGDVQADRCHCDRAPEFKRALERFGIVAVLSNPGKPQSNGLIESYVGNVIMGDECPPFGLRITRTLLAYG